MKRMILLAVLVTACATTRTTTTSTTSTTSATPTSTATAGPGGLTPEAALDGYLAGVRSGDIQAMGAMWGDNRGPARNSMVQEEYEKRLLIMQCLLRHNIASRKSGPTAKGDTVMIGMELRSGGRGALTTAHMLRGPSGRWFVLTFEPVPNLCPDR